MVRCMDSGSGNEQRAVPGERATLTLTSSHILQDISWASSPRAPSKGPGLQHFSSEDEEGEGEPVWPTSIWHHSSAPGTASKSSLPGTSASRSLKRGRAGSELCQWSTVHNQLLKCVWEEEMDSSKVMCVWL